MQCPSLPSGFMSCRIVFRVYARRPEAVDGHDQEKQSHPSRPLPRDLSFWLLAITGKQLYSPEDPISHCLSVVDRHCLEMKQSHYSQTSDTHYMSLLNRRYWEVDTVSRRCSSDCMSMVDRHHWEALAPFPGLWLMQSFNSRSPSPGSSNTIPKTHFALPVKNNRHRREAFAASQHSGSYSLSPIDRYL